MLLRFPFFPPLAPFFFPLPAESGRFLDLPGVLLGGGSGRGAGGGVKGVGISPISDMGVSEPRPLNRSDSAPVECQQVHVHCL